MVPGANNWVQEMSKLPYPFPDLAEKFYIPSSFDEFINITQYQVLEKESYIHSLQSRHFPSAAKYYRDHMLI